MNTVKTDVPFKSNSQIPESQPSQTTDSNKIGEQIDIKYIPTADGYICVFIKNNSDVVIDELEIQALFKDDAGVTISHNH